VDRRNWGSKKKKDTVNEEAADELSWKKTIHSLIGNHSIHA
jgi:hypothetical protein